HGPGARAAPQFDQLVVHSGRQSYKLVPTHEYSVSLASHAMLRTDKAEMSLTPRAKDFRETLKAKAPAYGVSLETEALDGLSQYFELVERWNSRVHLVAPCSPREFATRHVLESLTVLTHLRDGTRV